MPREIPSAARTWSLSQHTTTLRTNKETGRKYPANITRPMTGDPGPDGEVAERWPAAEFSVTRVLERWGAGRYTVAWYDAKGKKIGAYKFTADEPRRAPGAAARGRAGATAAPATGAADEGDVSAMTLQLPKTQLEWIMWNQARDEANERRRREEAREERDRMRSEQDERAQRDREFLASMAQALGGGGAHAAAAPAAAAGGVDLARELGLMKRELLLAQREQALQIRADVLASLPAPGVGGDEPETVVEALNGAGIGLVEGLGEEAPALVAEGLEAFKRWLKSRGQPATPQNMAAVVKALNAVLAAQGAGAESETQANGAAHDSNA
jgi:hypothetical protein